MSETYEEAIIESGPAPIALSIWKSRKEDPCIVFFPGTMTHPLFYGDFLGLLSSYGFNVIGVHPVGHGKSPRVKKIYGFEDLVRNGKDAVTYAIGRFNDNVVIMGSSQGGILAIALAAQDSRVRAAFPHNVLLPELPESIGVTRFPSFLRHLRGIMSLSLKAGSRIAPRLQIPLSLYLDLDRITQDKEIIEQVYTDPLGLTSYPLYFLSSLVNADMSLVSNGSIRCPIVVIAADGDPLFTLDYTRKVFGLIKAPRKELLQFRLDRHLIMSECVEEITETIAHKVKEYTRGTFSAAAHVSPVEAPHTNAR